ncbi:hypothetical protein JCM15765_43750 [Paradesulfitobacterium aromaticivorans]
MGLQIFEKYFSEQPDRLYEVCQDYTGRKQWFFRFIAGKYLSRFYLEEPAKVITLLEELAVDPVWQVREGAAWGIAALWDLTDNSVLDYYSRWLGDEREYLRATAALSLVPVIRKGDSTLLPLLIPLLDRLVVDESKAVRRLIGSQIIGKVLAEIFPETAYECLKRWVPLPNAVTQWQIARAVSGPLADRFPGEVMEILLRIQYQDQPLSRQALFSALKRLSHSTNPELVLAAQKYAEEIRATTAENQASL